LCKEHINTLQIVIGCLMPVITTIAFIFGLKQYRMTQKWKRQEFLANVIKDFFNDFYVGNALSMLDSMQINGNLKLSLLTLASTVKNRLNQPT
jgi:hypothetical protein